MHTSSSSRPALCSSPLFSSLHCKAKKKKKSEESAATYKHNQTTPGKLKQQGQYRIVCASTREAGARAERSDGSRHCGFSAGVMLQQLQRLHLHSIACHIRAYPSTRLSLHAATRGPTIRTAERAHEPQPHARALFSPLSARFNSSSSSSMAAAAPASPSITVSCERALIVVGRATNQRL